jgi:hypothetical protein
MVSIGGKDRGIFHYDVDVSRAFRAKKGEAIISIREPTSREYLKIAALSKEIDEEKNAETIDLVCGLIIGTTIRAEEGKDDLVNLDYLRQYVKDNGSLYLHLYQEWQKLLPFDKRM